MGLWNLIFRRGKYKKPATLTMANIKGFLQGNFRHFQDSIDWLEPKKHIKEQAIWRLQQVNEKSKECLMNSDCKICGCDPMEAVWEDRGCKNEENPCYPPMMGKAAWDAFKTENDLC